MPRFMYRKDSGELSDRVVIPIGFKFGDRDKLLCLDVTGLEVEDIELLDDMHKAYLEKIKAAGFYGRFRLFFMDGIEKVISE